MTTSSSEKVYSRLGKRPTKFEMHSSHVEKMSKNQVEGLITRVMSMVDGNPAIHGNPFLGNPR